MTKSDHDYQEFEKSPLAQSEEAISEFWRQNNIFEKSLEKPSPQGEYVFYEGPPTANGRPGIHHLESRAFKDAIPRYKTMQGYHVARRAGWDTHGLPVELEVEKQLGFSGKPDIEKYGIAEFNEKCRESVLKYVDEWQAFTDRIGYWLDHDTAYYTFNPGYMESVWWVFSQAAKNDLLYKDYKVLPWCSRCGTALSSHELAQGYKTVKDLSVTAKFQLIDDPDTFVLAWTTTPWTLPGNVALAVGEGIDYVKVKSLEVGLPNEEYFILAKDLAEKVFQKASKEYKIINEIKGSELVGLKYKPLYPYLSDLVTAEEKTALDQTAYQIYPADFVTTEDGTGIVHTAVMYGQDDFVLGNKIGLPKFHLVNEEGYFIQGTDFLLGRFVKDEQVAVDIIRDLALREEDNNGPALLFDKEKYEHTYPHCWRCKTPLIYYARDSWYIRMSDLRARLLENNDKINWEPDYIKNGRVEEWLRGVKDWAVSRERYWGTPLPIWEAEDGDRVVIDSVEELKKYLPETSFTFVRHAQATHNVANVADSGLDSTHDITDKGHQEIKDLSKNLNLDQFDIVVSSPLLRSQQTAKTLLKILKSDKEIVTEDLVREINFGEFNNRNIQEWRDARHSSNVDDYLYRPPEGEAFIDVKNRINKFLDEYAIKYPGKNILILTHGAVLEVAEAAAEGMNLDQSKNNFKAMAAPANCEVVEVEYHSLPKDEQGELNLHRPYIDEVVLEKDGKEYRRVKEVMDVWFDSGSMPWAQDHFPFAPEFEANRDGDISMPENNYPADYISEAIDQTRGWFYVLQAIAAFQGLDQAPYKNVICLGHILDAEGQKMSKSRGNSVNPWEMIAKYGADALRFWMYSVNQPGEPKNFDEKTVDEIVKKVFNLLRNSLSFYQMFSDHESAANPFESRNILDQWLLSRLNYTHQEVTKNLDNYKLLEATREIKELIADLSQWYIRRSRDRFKGSDSVDRAYALATTEYVIREIAKLLAPFTPHLSEEIWQQLRRDDDPESIHLVEWSAAGEVDSKLLKDMAAVRDLASVGLALRQQSNINTRQPLAGFYHDRREISTQLNSVLAAELNVQEVGYDNEIQLDTVLTPELVQEGQMRELLRAVQSLRKKMDLVPSDPIKLLLQKPTPEQLSLIKTNLSELESVAGVVELLEVTQLDKSRTIESFNGGPLTINIELLD
jgi:isoleucyl-tRNA synthetase